MKFIVARIYPIHLLAEKGYHKSTTLCFLCFIFTKGGAHNLYINKNGTFMHMQVHTVSMMRVLPMFVSSSEISVEGKT